MYATAEIEVGGSEPAILVPQGATQEVRGETVVFVQTAADRFEVRPVELAAPRWILRSASRPEGRGTNRYAGRICAEIRVLGSCPGQRVAMLKHIIDFHLEHRWFVC
jgi:hypothetical protein